MPIYKDVSSLELVTYTVPDGLVFGDGVDFVLEKLDAIPRADVEPVRHGCWKYANTKTKVRSTTRQCSNCGQLYKFPLMFPFAYCPNCGAKMDEKG